MMRHWKNSKKHFTQSIKALTLGAVFLSLGGCFQEWDDVGVPAMPRPQILKKPSTFDKKRLTHRVEIDTKTAKVRRMVFGQAVIRPNDISKIPTYLVVEPGDTLYKIAGRTGVSMRDLIEANLLMPPYALEVGRVLTLPKPRVHVVQKGETLQSIAKKWSVPLKSLMELNELVPPYIIFPGDELILPAGAQKTALKKAKLEKLPKPIEVKPVEEVSPEPEVISEKQDEKTPPPVLPVIEGPSESDTAWQAVQDMIPSLSTSRPPQLVAVAPSIVPAVKPAFQAETSPLASDPEPAVRAEVPKSAPTFGCPLQGKILSAYGAQKGGLYNDGLNIAAAEGAEIHAVQSGKVVYVGDQLKGYGQLILVKHKDGWMSAYGHVGKFLVKRGEKVRGGQAIGSVGTTGRVTAPQLHFELRDGVRSVDPAPLITCHV